MANVAEILIKTQADVTAMTHLNDVINALPPSAVEAAGGTTEALKRIITLEARNNVKALDTAIRGVISPAQVAATGVTTELAKINVVKPIAATDDLGKNILGLVGNGIEAAAGLTKELGHLVFTGTSSAITALGGTILSLVENGIEAAAGLTKELGHLVFTGTEAAVKALGGTILDLAARAGEAAIGVTKELGHLMFEGTVAALDNLGRKILDLPKYALAAAAGVRGALDTIGGAFHDGISTVADWAGNVIDWAKKAAIGIGLVTAALTVVGVEAVKSAASFQTMTTQIANNTTMTTADIATMTATVKRLGAESGAPLDQLANGFMHAFNMMGNASDATKVLDTAMKSAVSTGSDVSSVTETLAKVMHQFSIPTADAAKTMDELHLASALGNTTLEEFTSSTAKAMVAAANLHVPLEDVLAGFVGLTRSGYDAANASTQISGILTHLITPTKAAKEEIAKLSKATGVDLVGDFSLAGLKAKGLTAIMQDIEKATRGNEDAILKLIPAQRGAIGALALTGNAAGDVVDAMNQLNAVINDGATPTAVAYARTTATLGFQWNRLTEQFDLAKIALGDRLMPFVTRFVDYLITEAPKAHAALAGIFAAFSGGNISGGIAAVGDFLAPFVAKIASWIPVIIDRMAKIGDALIDWVTPRIPVLVEKIVGLGMRVADTIIDFLPTLIAAVAHWGEVLIAWVTPKIPPLMDKLMGLGLQVVGFIVGLLPTIERTLVTWGKAFADWVLDVAVPYLISQLPKIQQTITNFITTALPILARDTIRLASQLTTWVTTDAVPRLIAALPGWLSTLLGFIDQALPIIGATLLSVGKAFANWVTTSAIPMIKQHLPLWLETLAGFINGAIPVIFQLMRGLGDLLGTFILDAIPIVKKNLPTWLGMIGSFLLSEGQDLLRRIGNVAGELIGGSVGDGIKGKTNDLAAKLPSILNTVVDGFRRFADFLKNTVLPKVGEFFGWLTANLPHALSAVRDFAGGVKTFIENQIIPAIEKILAVGIPILERFAGWFRNTAIPALAEFAGNVKTLIVDTVIPTVLRLWNDLQPKLKQFADWFTTVGKPAIEQFAGGVKMFIVDQVIPAFHKIITDVVPILQSLFTNVKAIITKISDVIHDHGAGIQETIRTAWDVITTIIKVAIPIIADHIKSIIDNVNMWMEAVGKVRDWIVTHWPDIVDKFHELKAAVLEWKDRVVEFLGNVHDKVTTIHDWIVLKWDFLKGKFEELRAKVLTWKDDLLTFLGNVHEKITTVHDWIVLKWDFVRDKFEELRKKVLTFKDDAVGYLDTFKDKFQEVWQKAKDFISPIADFFDGIKTAINNLLGPLDGIIGKLGKIPGGIGSVIGGITGHGPTSNGSAPITAAPTSSGPAVTFSAPGSAVSSSLTPAAATQTVIHVNVAGSVTTARGLAEDVRTELLRMQRQGVNLGFN